MTHTSLRLRRIRSKLEEASRWDLSCFGSSKHKFRLNPPIPLDELVAFEKRHCIRLPEGYRRFLLELGNGGAGPYYGIYPLEKWNDLIDWIIDETPEGILARPSPLDPYSAFDMTPVDGIEDEDEWAEAVAAVYQGTLSIGTQGCTYMTQLIVSGPWAGRIVYANADCYPPSVIDAPDFLAWYERWIDKVLADHTIF